MKEDSQLVERVGPKSNDKGKLGLLIKAFMTHLMHHNKHSTLHGKMHKKHAAVFNSQANDAKQNVMIHKTHMNSHNEMASASKKIVALFKGKDKGKTAMPENMKGGKGK